MCLLNLWKKLKHQLSNCNIVFKKWLPTITVVAVFLPIWVTLAVYQYESRVKSNSLKIAFYANTCRNLQVANLLKNVEVGGQYQIAANFDTSFIKNNFSELYVIFYKNDFNPDLLFQALQIMDSQNIILSNQIYLPTTEVVSGGGQVVELFKQFGFELDGLLCKTPDYPIAPFLQNLKI